MSTPSESLVPAVTSSEVITRIIAENTSERKVYVLLERRYCNENPDGSFTWYLQPRGLARVSTTLTTGSVEVTRAITAVKKIRVLPFTLPEVEISPGVPDYTTKIRIHEFDTEAFNATRTVRYHIVLAKQSYEKPTAVTGVYNRTILSNMKVGGALRVIKQEADLANDNVQAATASGLVYRYDPETYVTYFPGDEFHPQSRVNLTKITISFPRLTMPTITETATLAYSGGPGYTFTLTFTTAHGLPYFIAASPFRYGRVYISGFTTTNTTADRTIIEYVNRTRGIIVNSAASTTTATFLARTTYNDTSDVPTSFQVTGTPSTSVRVTLHHRLFNIPVEFTCD